MANNSLMVFYEGAGMIRSVTEIVDMFAAPTPSNYKSSCICFLDDPYEVSDSTDNLTIFRTDKAIQGELFAFLMDMYGTWSNISDRYRIYPNQLITTTYE